MTAWTIKASHASLVLIKIHIYKPVKKHIDSIMAEETPSRMAVYRILGDDDEAAMDLTPIVLRDENNITIDEDYSRRMSFRNRHSSTLQAIEDDDDSHYMHFTFSQEPAELNGLNYLNLLVMMIHLFVSCGIQMLGLDGIMATHMQVSTKYETLITPAEWSQYIWAPILAAETVFSLAQLLPSFRSRPIIQDATGFFFFYVCLLQTAWVIVFSFHLFIPSFILVVGDVCVFGIAASTATLCTDTKVKGRVLVISISILSSLWMDGNHGGGQCQHALSE